MNLKVILLFLMMPVFISIIVNAAETKAPISQNQHETLIVGSEQNFPPFSTGMTDSTAGGFTVEFWKVVAEEADLTYTLRVLPFHKLLKEFKEGNIDVLINLAISDERQEFADFSVPHTTVHGAIFVRKDNTSINSEEDLSGHSIILLHDDLAHDYAKSQLWGKELVLVDTVAKGMKLLASGEHDAMLISKLVGMMSINDLGLINIKPLKTKVGFYQKFAFAVPEGQTDLLSNINEAIAINNIRGTYIELHDKWFGIYGERELTFRELSKYIIPLIVIFLAVSSYFHYQRQIERKQAREKLELAASVFSHAREGIIIADAKGKIIDVNDTFSDITGYTRQEAIGQNPRMFESPGRQSPEFYAAIWQRINTTDSWTGEVWNRRKNGDVYATRLNINAVKDDTGKIGHYVRHFSDITRQKDHQSQLEHMANYDALTNIPNRTLLGDRLNQAILETQRHHNSLAVVFLDLDDFKKINDTHGHVIGDELLIALSLRMKKSLRSVDTLARIGGDEFIAVLPDLVEVEDCQPVLDRLLLAASDPITVGDLVLKVSASIGVALCPQDNVDADMLMRHADQTMYLAKEAGKNCYRFFDTTHDDAAIIQRESLDDISAALDRAEFILHYQPKVNMSTGEIVGVEALIRWQHPVRGLLPPLDFLPVIEGQAISLRIGEWVIDTALSQIRQWQRLNILLPISVNISAYQLQQTDFAITLAALLANHPDVSPTHLQLEVLETSVLSDVNHVCTTMQACLELGVDFALDDFGTGYSSLTHLRHLPAKLIKIDQSFVRDMLDDVNDLAIIEGVISLAKAFKRDVIAEGVETIEHGTALLELGCELAQGYGIARPMPACDIPEWLTSWKPADVWRKENVK